MRTDSAVYSNIVEVLSIFKFSMEGPQILVNIFVELLFQICVSVFVFYIYFILSCSNNKSL